MDHILQRHGDRIREALRTRSSALRKLASPSRLPRWAYLLPVGLLLGAWAHRGSSEEGRLAWLAKHPPSDLAWNAVLSEKGFRSIEDPEWTEKAYAEMPEAARIRDSALISEDLRIVALRSSGEWRYFQLGRSASKKAPGAVVKRELWTGLGIGWEAMSALDRTEFPMTRTEPGTEPAGATQAWQDPRSIQY